MSSAMKIIIIGDSTVGKTSYIYRFIRGDFNANYRATLGGYFQVIQFNFNTCNLLVLWYIVCGGVISHEGQDVSCLNHAGFFFPKIGTIQRRQISWPSITSLVYVSRFQ